MKDNWLWIINDLRSNPRDLHTIPRSNKQPLWFYAYSDGTYIYVSNAKDHSPSSRIAVPRKLWFAEYERIYPIYLRREKGESVSREALAVTNNQVYWYAIFRFCLSDIALD